jgi:hypothetical protein
VVDILYKVEKPLKKTWKRQLCLIKYYKLNKKMSDSFNFSRGDLVRFKPHTRKLSRRVYINLGNQIFDNVSPQDTSPEIVYEYQGSIFYNSSNYALIRDCLNLNILRFAKVKRLEKLPDPDIKDVVASLPELPDKLVDTQTLQSALSPMLNNTSQLESQIAAKLYQQENCANDVRTYEDRAAGKKRDLLGIERELKEMTEKLKREKEIGGEERQKMFLEALKRLPLNRVFITPTNALVVFTKTLRVAPIQTDISGMDEDERLFFEAQPGKVLGRFLLILSGMNLVSINLSKQCLHGYDGPCIRNGGHCWGNLSDKVGSALDRHSNIDLLELMIDHITSPIYGSPYQSWEGYWNHLTKTDLSEVLSKLGGEFNEAFCQRVLKTFPKNTLIRLFNRVNDHNPDLTPSYNRSRLLKVLAGVKAVEDSIRIL